MRWIVALAIAVIVSASAHAEDWGVRRDPFDASVVRRYKAILARNPHDAGALRNLAALYKTYRTIAKLEAEYRELLARGDDWAALVVLARMTQDKRTEAVALWRRALSAKPDDVRGWLAVGDATVTDASAARDAYRKAAELATAPRDKKVALKKLIGAARTLGDAPAVDGAYGQLIALSPKDGGLWLDRGNAQLAAKQAAAAKTSFATAETLLRADPQRRLTAIMNQGIALEALGQPGDAIVQYERALANAPRGYFLAQELVGRIIETERKRKQVGAAIARLETRWPERARGFFEWSTLGDLHAETGNEPRAIEAYRRAIAVAPTEIVIQRKLIALLDKSSPTDALAQHEKAARVAPGDADLQLALAKRYQPTQPEKAYATLDALSRRMRTNVNVRASIAELFDGWNQIGRAIVEYEALADLEPREIDHLLTLGDAYWRHEKGDKAIATWNRLDLLGTRDARFRQGEILAAHELWMEAVQAFTRAHDLARADADVLYGRARAYAELGRTADAIEDARRAVALTASTNHDDGLRNRQYLVRVLGKLYDGHDTKPVAEMVARWRFAFARGDANAGYLLSAHYARLRTPQRHDVMVELYRLVPDDDSLGITLARSHARNLDFATARSLLVQIGQRNPARAKEIAEQIAQLDRDESRIERELRWEEEGKLARAEEADLVGRHRRFGVRLGFGTDVRVTDSAQLGIGLYRAHRVARGTTLATRFDWSQRDDVMEEVNAFALAGSIATRILDARKLELAVGVGPRVELRFGSDLPDSKWDRLAVGADATLELLPRAIPATLGMRFHQSVTDPGRSSSVFFELGFELR